jgi:prevent-host-death family protein
MMTLTATEANNNLEELWRKAATEPVIILRDGQPLAVVLSPAKFAGLMARRTGAKAGFAKHLYPNMDMNALLDTNLDDVFGEYR